MNINKIKDPKIRQLYRQVFGTVVKYFSKDHRFLNDPAIAFEDLLQEGVSYALLAHQTYNPGKGTHINTWVRIKVFQGLHHLLRRNVTIMVYPDQWQDPEVEWALILEKNSNISEEDFLGEIYEILVDECLKLPLRQALLTLYSHGIGTPVPQTQEELAIQSGLSRNQVAYAISTAKSKLSQNVRLKEFFENHFE